jgi:hypothetical protein
MINLKTLVGVQLFETIKASDCITSINLSDNKINDDGAMVML